jgi:FMN phosphatase YigB (HAD superfamily)
VGNRLDTDVRGAHRVGLRTVWVLRGEAPPNPTPEQLDEPDISVFSLAELPNALDRLQRITE